MREAYVQLPIYTPDPPSLRDAVALSLSWRLRFNLFFRDAVAFLRFPWHFNPWFNPRFSWRYRFIPGYREAVALSSVFVMLSLYPRFLWCYRSIPKSLSLLFWPTIVQSYQKFCQILLLWSADRDPPPPFPLPHFPFSWLCTVKIIHTKTNYIVMRLINIVPFI